MVVDYCSRWLEAILLKKPDVQHVIKDMKAICRTYGLAEALCNDNGPPFLSKKFVGFLEYLGISHKKGVYLIGQRGTEKWNVAMKQFTHIDGGGGGFCNTPF